MTTTTSHNNLGGAQYRSGAIMSLTQDDGDNAIDVTYFIKPDQGRVTTLNAMSTFTTEQPFTTIRVLKPIINNTVRTIVYDEIERTTKYNEHPFKKKFFY